MTELLKKLEELEVAYCLLKKETEMNYNTEDVYRLLKETKILVKNLALCYVSGSVPSVQECKDEMNAEIRKWKLSESDPIECYKMAFAHCYNFIDSKMKNK